MTREPITIVEIDQPLCSLTYGVAPCQAALGVTGPRRCFNTLRTCQDESNFTPTVLTLRFSTPNARIPGVYLIPSIRAVSTTPQRINPGGASDDLSPLGKRATVTISLSDMPHTDRLTDPYRDTRDYNPLERGTFWGKWLARNPYYRYLPIRVLTGYAGDALGDMRVKQYLIDRIDGPNRDSVTIRAKDPLVRAQERQSKAPEATRGLLSAQLNASAATFVLVGTIAGEYPTDGGTLRIGDEIMTYTSASFNAGNNETTISGVTRSTDGTSAESHDEDDRAQVCLRYVGQEPQDIIYDLLVNFAGVEASFIDLDDWKVEVATWLTGYNLSSLITEPTGVDELVGEICESAQLYVYWDEREQEVVLKVSRPLLDIAPSIDDDADILADSITVVDDPNQRASQVWVYYLQIDPTEDVEEDGNFRRIRIRAVAGDPYADRPIRRVYSRWLTTDAQAIDLSTRMLNRFSVPPKVLTVTLPRGDLWTSDQIDVTTRYVVDDTGAPVTIRYEVVSAEDTANDETIYTLQSTTYVGRLGTWMAVDAPDYTTAVAQDVQDSGMWWSESDGTMTDGSEGYQWI